RPLLASGDRTPVQLEGSLILSQTTLAIEAIKDAGFWPPVAMALTNALLTVRPAHRLFVNGTLGEDDALALESGTLSIENALYQALPFLPDPYAANFDARLGRDGPFPESTVSSRVVWS